jgi:hypothetical protein
VLDGGEDLSDPAVWNLLSLRSVTTTFSHPGQQGSFMVTAEFGNGVYTPEPSTAVGAVLMLLLSTGLIYYERRTNRVAPLKVDRRQAMILSCRVA